MNEFIKLRESIFDYEDIYGFTQVLLNNYMDKESKLTSDERLFLNRLNNILHINNNNKADKKKLLELLSYLGENPYIDRYIINTIIKVYNTYPREKFMNILETEINNENNKREKTYHLLDLILEFDFDVLTIKTIITLLNKNKLNFDVVTLLIDYIDHFKIEVSKGYLYKQLTKDYPNTINIKILDVLDNLYSIDSLDLDLIESEIKTKENIVFVNSYIDFLKGKYQRDKKGVVILQSMFYGDFEGSGKGNNGGLAILLKNLGNEISIDNRIDTVITITISDVMKKPFMAYYQDNHLFVRLPAYLDKTAVDPFLKGELFIKRFIKSFLIKLNIIPDIFHIRYLDNASMAVAKASKDLNRKLVLTLATDPHRNMSDEKGCLKNFNFDEIQVLLNKIKIGDKLIYKSDKVLGIGGRKVNEELMLYFPQFSHYNIEHKIKMIAEGIKTDEDISKNGEDVCICELSELIGIDQSFCDKPIILNVGRLAKLKGQVALFEAWSSSKLNETHNLLIIGGDLKNPNQEEKEIIGFFDQRIKERPKLKDKFFHKGAMDNEEIKLVEKSIMRKSFDYPHIYLASSLKEEFGIAILEAMYRGFLILAPIKGGVKSYITNGENGFLINTSNYKTIAMDCEEILYNLNISNKEFKQIQKLGQDIIKKEFSIDKIAKKFTDTYLSLLGGKEDEV